MDVETFAKTTHQEHFRSQRGSYVLGSNLISAIQMALVPEDQTKEFPRWFYGPPYRAMRPGIA